MRVRRPEPKPVYIVAEPRPKPVGQTIAIVALVVIVGALLAVVSQPLPAPAAAPIGPRPVTSGHPIATTTPTADEGRVLDAVDAALVRFDEIVSAKDAECSGLTAPAAYDRCSSEYDALSSLWDELSACGDGAGTLDDVAACEARAVKAAAKLR